MRPSRRAFILGGAALAAAGCGQDERVAQDPSIARQVAYGDDASQFGELSLPSGAPRGAVVVIHGGFWRSAYDLSLGRPLAASLVEHGWAAWNLEYRRVGNGGGYPSTFDDVAAGIDKLADLDLDLSTVVTLGHSAGGHLAAWAGGRDKYDAWPARVKVTGVISQAGVLDLRQAQADHLGNGAVAAFLGHEPGPGDAAVDPMQQLPLDVPVWCVHGTEDEDVPPSQSRDYVAAATAAGGQAHLVEVTGDHYVVIEEGSRAWERQLEILDEMA